MNAHQMVSQKKYPHHVAIIMDGNGRWASQRGLPRSEGHRMGLQSVRQLVEYLKKTQVKILTLYAFSTENWNRSELEINFLMGLVKTYISQDLEKLHNADVRIKIIGKEDGLAADIVKFMKKAEDTTAQNKSLTLQIAFNYGTWQEVTAMAKSLVAQAEQGQLSSNEITEETIRQNLMTADIPDPDLIIRTSGEHRLSNFMLLQSAYAELVFQPVLWPDYSTDDFEAAIDEYLSRHRRFGHADDSDNQKSNQQEDEPTPTIEAIG